MKWTLILSMVGLDVAVFVAIYGSMRLIGLFASALEARRSIEDQQQGSQEDVSQVLAVVMAHLYQRGARFNPHTRATRKSVSSSPQSGWLPPLVAQRATSWKRMRIDTFTCQEPLKSMRQCSTDERTAYRKANP